MAKTDLTLARLRELLNYDPETGIFTHRTSRNRAVAGRAAGTVHKVYGYVVLPVDRRQFRAHRLAWFFMHAEWPDGQIDHINGVRTDNRLSNLRVVDAYGNAQNHRRAKSDSKSGLLGAHLNYGSWVSTIGVNGKHIYLGRFSSAQEAHEAYVAAKRRLHPTCTI